MRFCVGKNRVLFETGRTFAFYGVGDLASVVVSHYRLAYRASVLIYRNKILFSCCDIDSAVSHPDALVTMPWNKSSLTSSCAPVSQERKIWSTLSPENNLHATVVNRKFKHFSLLLLVFVVFNITILQCFSVLF